MAFFKAVCAKNNQKIELLVQFGSIEEARENLHRQWYSIIELKETSGNTLWDTGVFYFDILADWKVKTWQISSNDIFKAYVKLVDNLHYDVIHIYDQKDRDEKEKILITQKVKNSYDIFKWTKVEQDRKNEEKKIEDKKQEHVKSQWENLPEFLKKELNFYYGLIDKVLEKIDFILNNFRENLSEEKKEKLNELYNKLKQVKNITNVTKLKLIWEIALVKIWELQVELLEGHIIDNKKWILSETNKLLKSFWSSKQVILPEDDIRLKLNKIINDLIDNFKDFIKTNAKKDKIDKNSWKYYDILREKNIYEKKLKEVNKEITKNFFNKENKKRLELKKKLIKQNITLLWNRINNKKISYTKTIKGFNYYKDVIIYLLQRISDTIIYSLFIYSLFFVFLNISSVLFWKNLDINYDFLLYISLFAFLGFLLKISKNFIILAFCTIIYILFFIFLVINF
ncbi:MAG: hypothetical protein ACD_2C00221G0010 [uncultured bacterium (gcode 4)]|uniref:Uncharacterized protein n=1 Tax=uncultured bacterium (gcode 4) TaxID=1234023 RepID=K2G1R5_9BACT|nr:MAG: hypothetical protein ACD_2C00221G0010 [uncultured bacterium (gcode 4)]